jgi:hypothetical protein
VKEEATRSKATLPLYARLLVRESEETTGESYEGLYLSLKLTLTRTV